MCGHHYHRVFSISKLNVCTEEKRLHVSEGILWKVNLFDNVKDNINLYYMTHYITFDIPPPKKKIKILLRALELMLKKV